MHIDMYSCTHKHTHNTHTHTCAYAHMHTRAHTQLHGYGCIYTLHGYNMASLVLFNNMLTLSVHT